MKLRDYQIKQYNEIVDATRRGKKKILVQSPCGTGKSFLFLALVKTFVNKNKEVLILVHRIELKRQHEELLKANNIDMSKVRVEMIIKESHHMREKAPDLIIVDEAHLSKAKTWETVISEYDTFTVGFTATPVRLDGKPLNDIYDTLITSESSEWFIENKYLADYSYYAPMTTDVSTVNISYGDFNTVELEKLLRKRAIYSEVFKSWLNFADGKQTIAYCVSIAHSKEVCEEFNKHNIAAAHIDGNTPQKEREQILRDFKNGKITVLCNCMLIIEGVNVPDCSCCLLLRPTWSTALYIQSAMRCMRYKPNKHAIIIDCVGNYARHGILDNSMQWSLDAPPVHISTYNKDGLLNIRTCKSCFKVFKTAPVCPYCGTIYEPQTDEIEQIKNIELQELKHKQEEAERKRKNKVRYQTWQAETIGDLLKIAKENGYKPRWAYIQARIRGIYY